MKTTIRKIGNSRGVILPKSFIEECGMKDVVSIELVDDAIVIRAEKGLRQGWFENYVPDEDVLGDLPIEDVAEWEWE